MLTVYLCGDGLAKNWPTSGWNLSRSHPFSNVLILAWVHDAIFPICRSPRSANSRDVLHPVRFPGLALVWRVRLLPVAGCRSDVGPEEARPNSLSLHRIIPIERTHAVVEASNHGRIQWFRWRPAVEPPD